MSGGEVKPHCCASMADHVEGKCADHPDRYDCPDMLIDHWPRTNQYGIIVHDGGRSMIVIHYCPWCGSPVGDPE